MADDSIWDCPPDPGITAARPPNAAARAPQRAARAAGLCRAGTSLLDLRGWLGPVRRGGPAVASEEAEHRQDPAVRAAVPWQPQFVEHRVGVLLHRAFGHEQLLRDGYRLRVYVPYGSEWYSYLMRRMAERPANLLFVARNLFRK